MDRTLAASVAANVRAEAARRRVRLADLATTVGISRSSLHRRLMGEVPFDVDELQHVADHLGLDVVDLLQTSPAEASA